MGVCLYYQDLLLATYFNMSSNDIIYLDLHSFTVKHTDIEMDEDLSYREVKCKDLKTALKTAKKIQDKNNPEYGIWLLNNPK